MSRGSIGDDAERSIETNPMLAATAIAADASTSGEPHPRAEPSIRKYVIPTSETTPKAAPGRSTPRVLEGSRDSGTCLALTARTKSAKGTLMKKIQRHEAAETR